MSNIHNQIILALLDDLKKLSEQSSDIYKELHGIYEVPEYRKLYAHIIVDCESKNGELLHNYELLEPENEQKKLEYMNFKRLVISTGLLFLSNQIEDILDCNLEKVEIDMLNRIFIGQFNISKGNLIVTDEEFTNMLNSICDKYL